MSRLSFGSVDLYSTPLRDFSKSLTGKECDILCRRAHHQTMEEIGKLYGVSRVRIRQIQLNALRKLKSNEDEIKLSCQWHPPESKFKHTADCRYCGNKFEENICLSLFPVPEYIPERVKYCSEGCFHDALVKRQKEKKKPAKRLPRGNAAPKSQRQKINYGKKETGKVDFW
jgi:DNA-binding CsgD family transcriptional regulator